MNGVVNCTPFDFFCDCRRRLVPKLTERVTYGDRILGSTQNHLQGILSGIATMNLLHKAGESLGGESNRLHVAFDRLVSSPRVFLSWMLQNYTQN